MCRALEENIAASGRLICSPPGLDFLSQGNFCIHLNSTRHARTRVKVWRYIFVTNEDGFRSVIRVFFGGGFFNTGNSITFFKLLREAGT